MSALLAMATGVSVAQTWQSGERGPVTNATAGAACTPNGSIGLDQWNRKYTCVGAKWRHEHGTGGEYTFTITGQTPTLMRGYGTVNTSNSTFTGSLMCDPYTVNASCGSYGRYWCGSDASCAWYVAYNVYVYYKAGVADLPVTSITTIR